MQSSSPYLAALVDPRSYTVRIPDDQVVASVLKSTTIATTYQVPSTLVANQGQPILFIVPFSSDRRTVKVYVFDAATNRFHWLRDFYPDEDIYSTHALFRLVSAFAEVISSTTSGTTFNVSGSVNSASVQDLPSIRELTHENLTSFKRANVEAVASVPVAEGVCAISGPEAGHPFRPPESNNQSVASTSSTSGGVASTADKYSSNCVIAANKGLTAPLAPRAPGLTAITVLDFDGLQMGDKTIEPWGINEIVGTFVLGTAPGLTTQAAVNVEFTFDGADPNTWADAPLVVPVVVFAGAVATTEAFQIYAPARNDRPLRRVRITIQNTGANPLQINQAEAIWRNLSYYGESTSAPSWLASVKGAFPQQQIDFMLRSNLEAVPNSGLARNVGTEWQAYSDPLALEIGERFFASQDSGVRLTWARKDYHRFLQRMYGMSPDQVVAQAATMGGFFSKLWRAVRPGLAAAAPIVGGLVGARFGQPGAGYAVGEALGRGIANASTQDIAYASTKVLEVEAEAANKEKHAENGNAAAQIIALRGAKATLPVQQDSINPAALGLLRDHDGAVLAKVEAITGGPSTGIKATAQKFVATLKDSSFIVRIITSDRPVDTITMPGRRPKVPQYVAHGPWRIDADLIVTDDDAALLESEPNGMPYVTIDYNAPVAGGSWFAALYACTLLVPGRHIFTGHPTRASTNLVEKLLACAAVDEPLFMWNPDPVEVASLEQSLAGSGSIPEAGFTLQNSGIVYGVRALPDQLHLLMHCAAMRAFLPSAKKSLDPELKQQEAAVQKQITTQKADPIQTVRWKDGPKDRELTIDFDAEDISPLIAEREQAIDALEAAGTVVRKKIQDYLDNSSYNKLAGLLGQVFAKQASMDREAARRAAAPPPQAKKKKPAAAKGPAVPQRGAAISSRLSALLGAE